MSELILVRGLPGSGKTTIAEDHFQEAMHFEADHFFEGPDGYKFNPKLIKAAHAWCQALVERELVGGAPQVIVTNTFTQRWEMQTYLNMAQVNGVPVRIIVARGKFNNIHGVPYDTIQKMKDRWEDIEGEILWEDTDPA